MKSISKSSYIYSLFFFCILTLCLFAINVLKDENGKISDDKSNISDNQEKNIEKIKEEIIYSKANETIRVKISSTGEVIAMDTNDYLRCVVLSEMPGYYELEALKAQALVARTYLYKKIQEKSEDGCDICDNANHCQAYLSNEKLEEIWKKKGYDENTIYDFWYKANEAVSLTQNEIITYNGSLINAFFHASSPYKTENVDQIWGKEKVDYLVSVENVEDEDYENRYSSNTFSFDNLNEILTANDFYTVSLEEFLDIHISDYTNSGRVNNVVIGKNCISAEKLRQMFGLKSTVFTIKIASEEKNITFDVVGYGHGIGMSQVGANTFAKKGYSYEDIVRYYYKGVEIKKI